MEENQNYNMAFPSTAKQRESDQVNLLDSNQIFSEPSTSREWFKNKWEEITGNVSIQTEIINERSTGESACCDFLKCWRGETEENSEVVVYDHYIPAVQCDRDNLCKYCRTIRKQQLTDKRRQLEVVLKLYEKQLKLLNQKEKDLIEKPGKKPSIFRRWGNVFKLSGSTSTINSVDQLPEGNSKVG